MQYFRIFFALNEDLSDLVKTKTGENPLGKSSPEKCHPAKIPLEKKTIQKCFSDKMVPERSPRGKKPLCEKIYTWKKAPKQLFSEVLSKICLLG